MLLIFWFLRSFSRSAPAFGALCNFATICHYCCTIICSKLSYDIWYVALYMYICYICYVFQSVDRNSAEFPENFVLGSLLIASCCCSVCVHNFCNYTLPISSNIFISFEKREREREVLLTLFRAKRNSVRYVAIFILMPQSFLAGVDSNKYHVHPLPLFLFMAPPRHYSLPHLMLLHCGRPNCN